MKSKQILFIPSPPPKEIYFDLIRKRLKVMIIRSHVFLPILLLTVGLLPTLSSSQYDDSPRNIETYYNPTIPPAPAPSPSPSPAAAKPSDFPKSSPPPLPPKPGRKKTIITGVGVTAASALVVAALVFLFISRRRSRSENETRAVPAIRRSQSEDKQGLDVVYWNELQKTFSSSASRVHPHPPPLDVSHAHTQYSGNIVEDLFGTLATNRGKPDRETETEIFILDPVKSHEMKAVLRSLGVPRDNLIAALLQGKGVSQETLEKLTPTNDEQSRILAFSGDPATLAEAESFLYALLKAFPSAFTQLQWRLNLDSDILVRVKEPLRTMEAACDELRNRGSFLKLMQAVQNAGARLYGPNPDTKPAFFNLGTLAKLSNYTSSDGKTTLLHFVVHQVVRNEGRRGLLARSKSISRSTDSNSDSGKADKEREFLRLGLPVVGGLSSEFANVKKAADIDYDTLNASLDSLVIRIKQADAVSGGGFLESAEKEIKAAQLEHKRVINLVNKTAQYYQGGGTSNYNNPLQLFVIVKDFLSMTDQACVEIARSLQNNSASGSDSSDPDVLRTRVNFLKLPPGFFTDSSSTTNSGSGDDSRPKSLISINI